MRIWYFGIFFCLAALISLSTKSQQLEVKNNWFYIDGEKFFVKGIGYEAGAQPGGLPWARTFNSTQWNYDIKRILSGGFNTIRTWSELTSAELNLLKQYDIKIIMGIWIDPAGNFADPQFVNNAKALVNNVLNYSKNYNNIIGYLIMNEPLPETVFSAGYDKTVNLWKDLIAIIHTKHPGRPVSIANTPNGTYIYSGIFDFSAYNVYIYNPVTVNYLHEYRNYIDYLQKLNKTSRPLVVSEYGLSVSPTGPGNWGYGGNSLTQQQEGDLHMYKSLVDGGANGSCIFIYSDGWWKAGDEFTHNDAAEEWFGLVGYSSLSDKQGSVRPAWNAIRDYQSAIIAQPRSEEIYLNKIPVEIFLNDTIKKIDVLLGNTSVYQKQIESSWLLDTIEIDFQQIKDLTLKFNCYDHENNLVKSEEKNILLTKTVLTLPIIEISTNSNCWQTGSVTARYQITKSADFTTDTKIEYIYYPHVGFDYGQKFQRSMSSGNSVSFSGQYSIGGNVNVFTIGAAFDIYYNTFKKRIYNQVTLARYDVTTNAKTEQYHSVLNIQVFPNPATDYLSVTMNNNLTSPDFEYEIYSVSGLIVKKSRAAKWNTPIDISTLESGVYSILINCKNLQSPQIRKILKLN